MLEWVPAGLNTGALSGAKASSSRTRDTSYTINKKTFWAPTTQPSTLVLLPRIFLLKQTIPVSVTRAGFRCVPALDALDI
jgi:hypothetical protein